MVRIDFHVHSMFSKRPSAWFLKKIGCPESFTEPLQIYRIAKKRDMTHVTIADHNCIEGALAIAHLPNTFISEEITTYFPEDRCKVHVLAFNINETQHNEIQKLRPNIFDLVAYLQQEAIPHALAHALYKVNDRLTPEHVEKLILLFKVFELNGARNDEMNNCLEDIFAQLTPEYIEFLANKHNLEPADSDPWRKAFIGGSDDHSSLNIARTYTEIDSADSLEDALAAIDRSDTQVMRRPADPQTLAHNLYGIAYQFYCSKFDLDNYVNKDDLMTFLDLSLRSGAVAEDSRFMSRLSFLWHHRRRKKAKSVMPESLMDMLRHESNRMLADNPQLKQMAQNKSLDYYSLEHNWFDFVNQASSRVLYHFANPLLEHLSGANVFDIFQTIGSAGGLYTFLAPYFIGFSLFSRDRRFAHEIRNHFKQSTYENYRPVDKVNVAHFTDTFYEVNGVALSLQQQVKSALRHNKDLTVITCRNDVSSTQPGVKNFKPIGVYELPEYPEQKLFYPPLLEILDYCYRHRFNRLHSATPGPIGLAALAVARILKLPIYGTYHTSLPQYAEILTGDHIIEDLVWKFTLWYYDQMDLIYVPSSSTGDELIEKGIASSKIRLFPRGIDIERFHPSKRNGYLKSKHQIQDVTTLLYVGRVSKEKNLHLLTDVFKELCKTNQNIHLIVVGDGPYLEEMKGLMQDLPCTFTGYLKGEELAAVYASSDIFVFPSTTDTFGNVVLEAQASGLPVIVTDQGGPHENMILGETGLVAQGNDHTGLQIAVQILLNDTKLMRKMGKAARRYMEERSFEAAFTQTWEMYCDKQPIVEDELMQAII
jgi:glycosyltransferase involved in cell wall biosynthesis